ncbi:MAG: hypothetical protein K2I36_01815 [Ureaplasma sp.]|nr:hypothetical protein [Ureaplasma sp.]
MKITSYRINEETRYLSINQQPIIGRSLISKLKSLEEKKKYKFTFGSSNITLTDFYLENEKMINKY